MLTEIACGGRVPQARLAGSRDCLGPCLLLPFQPACMARPCCTRPLPLFRPVPGERRQDCMHRKPQTRQLDSPQALWLPLVGLRRIFRRHLPTLRAREDSVPWSLWPSVLRNVAHGGRHSSHLLASFGIPNLLASQSQPSLTLLSPSQPIVAFLSPSWPVLALLSPPLPSRYLLS